MDLGIFSINDTIYFRANTVTKQGSSVDATAGPTFKVFADDGTTAISTGTMSKVGTETGYYEGTFSVAAALYSDGQHFILIQATVDGETPASQLSFQLVSDELSLEETFQEIQMIGEAIPIIGEGTVSIDHNFGKTDNYRVTASGTPLADVDIRAFVKTDYDAGLRANKYIIGQTKTKTDGRWVSVIRLDPGDYVLEFSKPGSYKTNTVDVTVSGVSVMSMAVESMSLGTEMEYETSEIMITTIPSGIYVDHNYKGKDNLRIVSKDKPISGVNIKIFNKADYDTGRTTENNVIQRTVTNQDGRWEKSLMLQPNNSYVVEFSKKGKFATNIKMLQL